jgi:hypothetical protein
MEDIATIGTLAAAILATATDEIVKGVAAEAVKDGYKALKNKLLGITESDTNALAANPNSKARQAVVAEIVDEQSDDVKSEVFQLMNMLVEAIEVTRYASPIGIDVAHIKSFKLQIAEIDVDKGTGIRADTIVTENDFNVGKIKVGK